MYMYVVHVGICRENNSGTHLSVSLFPLSQYSMLKVPKAHSMERVHQHYPQTRAMGIICVFLWKADRDSQLVGSTNSSSYNTLGKR